MKSILHDREALVNSISKSKSAKEVLENLGLRPAGGNYAALKAACQKFDLKTPTYDRLQAITALSQANRLDDSVIFVENSTYTNRRHIKSRMFKMGIQNQCLECGQLPFWKGKPLTLQLDHINGISNDNRLSNLRILCGHCHSQTDTFCGRNKL